MYKIKKRLKRLKRNSRGSKSRNMAKSVILSAIERLDSWLLKKPDLLEENFEKLYSLLKMVDPCIPSIEMADWRKAIKENLYNFLAGNSDFGEDNNKKLYNFLVEIVDFRKDNMDKLLNMITEMGDFSFEDKKELYAFLRDLLLGYKKMMFNFLNSRAYYFTENNKQKLIDVLIGMADFWKDDKKRLYFLLIWMEVSPNRDYYRNKTNVNNLLVEMTKFWEDDKNDKLNTKLQTLLSDITELIIDEWRIKDNDEELYLKKGYNLMEDKADLCKNVKIKLNMDEVSSWLSEKAVHWEHNKLFRLMLNMVFRHENEDAKEKNWNMVEYIRGKLRCILDFLRDKKYEEGSSLHYFISDAVEMAHDVQLLIDIRDFDPFIIFVELNRGDQDLICEDASQFTSKVYDIHNWIGETTKRMELFGAVKAMTKLQNVGEGGEGVVVGLEEDIELLLGIKDTHTTFIRGMAGIGKTTLARMLYNHPDVVNEFKCRAWVCVSKESSRKEILTKLIQELEIDVAFQELEIDVASLDNKLLKQKLHKYLQSKRYFIVLDDVWGSALLWKYFENFLPKGDGSRLVLTTRPISKFSSGTKYEHKMKYLDDKESWQLLMKTMFFRTSDQEFPKNLEKRGRKMLAKCNGLPLAIKEVGRKWAEKRKLTREWEQIVESIDLSETLVALETTYQDLDPLVKSCFLHLSFFEEGRTITLRKLIRIWIVADGTISEKDIRSKDFVSELAEASIFEETSIRRSKTCRVNTVFHMLSIKKAEEEMKLEILRNDGLNNRLSDNPRHHVIYCSREKITYSTNHNGNHLVSLFFRGGGFFDASPSYWKQVKILDMEDFGLKMLPDVVGTLLELRYLGLRNNYIQELPCSLSSLRKLKVLDIALNFMMEVPDIIWEMGSLQHLYMSDIICQKPKKIDTLKNLQTLTYISVDNWVCELSGSEMLSSLSKLGIEELDRNSDISKLFASLAKLKNLDHLILRGTRYRSMPSLDELGILCDLSKLKLEGRLKRLPSANYFPQNIKELSLVNSSLDEDPMPILENLHWLIYLKLQNAYTGQKMVISSDGFRKIDHMIIKELWNLRNVEVGKHVMCRISQLEIINCPYLETLAGTFVGRKQEEVEHGDYQKHCKNDLHFQNVETENPVISGRICAHLQCTDVENVM